MILHIVPDEKFIDMAYDIFEEASPNNNEFMVVTKQKKFKYIKTTPITKISRFKFLSKQFANSLKRYEFVVILFLGEKVKNFILNTDDKIKFVCLRF